MFDAQGGLLHRGFDPAEIGIASTMERMVILQRRAAEGRHQTVSERVALSKVSHAALDDLLDADAPSDIRTDPDISNCLVFNTGDLPGSVHCPQLDQLRASVDEAICDWIEENSDTAGNGRLHVRASGHFLYPPTSYMGWHTNARVPGWRVYVSHAAEPGKSFFRYFDPAKGEVVTSWDRGWDLRVFPIDPDRPFWHAVYSNTYRSSLGYRVVENQN